MGAVKLHASVIKRLITVHGKYEMCHCRTFIIFNIRYCDRIFSFLLVFSKSASFNALLASAKSVEREWQFINCHLRQQGGTRIWATIITPFVTELSCK